MLIHSVMCDIWASHSWIFEWCRLSQTISWWSIFRYVERSRAVCQCTENDVGAVSSVINRMCCRCWKGKSSKSTGKSWSKNRRYTTPVSVLGGTAGPKSWSPNTVLVYWSVMHCYPITQTQISPISCKVLVLGFTSMLTGTSLLVSVITVRSNHDTPVQA
jgi:hypothetical protein